MTFEAWVRSQIELRATVSVRLGQSQDGASASIMTWSDKRPGTWFWDVHDELVTLIEFMDARGCLDNDAAGSCPAGHGDQCCGRPDLCRDALKTGR